MPARNRGRPRGSSPHREDDDKLLRKTALLLSSGGASTATEAFRTLLGIDDDAGVRRLQRRWRRDGDKFCQELRRQLLNQRWERDARALEESAPEIFAKVTAFARSEGGAEVLADEMKDSENSPLMSLGLMKLWELTESNSPIGAAAAEAAFEKANTEWCRYGCDPDPAFLRRFAELCLNRAGDLPLAPQDSSVNSCGDEK